MDMQRRCCRSSWSGQGRTTFQRVVCLVPRLHQHPSVANYTCIYDVQLLAIWHIPLLAVVLLLSLALHVGLLQRHPTSPCLSCFRNDRLDRRTLCTAKLVCFLDVVALRWNHRHCSVSSVHKSRAWKEDEALKYGCCLFKLNLLITQCC